MITLYRHAMNKTQLVDALAARIGDRRAAATVVDGLIETIVDTVRAGGSVSISGFGVFESRARAARMARNPRTGEAVNVAATTVPAFRAGLAFRNAVGSSEQSAARAPTTRRTRPSAATEAAAVADAPAKVARGRSKVAAPAEPPDAAPKAGRKASGKKDSAAEPVGKSAGGKSAGGKAAKAAAVAEKAPHAEAVSVKSAPAKGSSEKAVSDKASAKGKKGDKPKSAKKAKKAKK